MERPSIDASHVRRAQSTCVFSGNAKSASCPLRRQPQHGATPAAQGPVDAQQAPPVASPAMAMATALRRAAPPVARPRLARGSGTAAAQKCRIAASRGVSVVRAYGDRRRNDDAPRGGGGWTNEFGDEYDAIDDDDGYFEERRAPAGRPDRGRAPDRGRRFDDDRRRGGFGRAEVGDLRRRGEGGRDGGRRNDRRRDDDGDWVEVRPNDVSAREETRGARPHGGVSTFNLKPRGCAFFFYLLSCLRSADADERTDEPTNILCATKTGDLSL